MVRILAAAVVLAAVGIGGWVWWSGQQETLPVEITTNASEDSTADASVVADMTLGDPNAPITVVEYASYTCPHCATFHAGTFKELKANYIDTGKVHFIFREVYFDQPGLWASMVARCAGPERYFGVADMLFSRMSDWARAGSPGEIANALRRIGLAAGISEQELDACLSDGQMAQNMVAAYQENATRDGIRATPSFVIDGELHSNMSYADFSELLDGKLGE